MRRLTRNRGFLAVSFLLLAAGSLWMLLAGSGAERVLGVACLIMFGGGGAAWMIGEFLTPPAGPPRRGMVPVSPAHLQPGLVIPIRSGRLRAAVAAQACFLVAAILIAVYPDDVIGGGLVTRVVFIAVAAVLAVSVIGALRDRETRAPMVGLTEKGVLTHSFGQSVYAPWKSISAIRETDVRGSPYLAFDLSDPGAIRRRGGSRALSMLDGPLLGIDHAISPVGLSLDPEGFARLIRHFHANPGERALLATAPAADLLARAGVEVGSSGGP